MRNFQTNSQTSVSEDRGHFYRFGEFTVDADQKVLLRDGTPLPLTPRVFETLLVVENSGRLVGKKTSIWKFHGMEVGTFLRQLRQAVKGSDGK